MLQAGSVYPVLHGIGLVQRSRTDSAICDRLIFPSPSGFLSLKIAFFPNFFTHRLLFVINGSCVRIKLKGISSDTVEMQRDRGINQNLRRDCTLVGAYFNWQLHDKTYTFHTEQSGRVLQTPQVASRRSSMPAHGMTLISYKGYVTSGTFSYLTSERGGRFTGSTDSSSR